MISEFLKNQQQGGAGGAAAGSGFGLDQLLTGPGGLATGAAAGGLAAMLLGGAKPKKLAKNALKVGGVALVGGLAYKAYRDWQANKVPVAQQAEPVADPSGTPFLPTGAPEQHSLSRKIARAMITAAKADGHVTAEEQSRIVSQLEAIEVDSADRAFLEEELRQPFDIESVVRDANTQELAAELYAASLLAVDPDGPAERAYLSLLAARLRLEPGLVAHLHANAAAM